MPNCGICGDRIFLNRPYIRDDDSGKIFHQKCTKTHCMACGGKVDKTKPYGLHKVSGSVFHPDCMDKPKSAGKTKSKRQKRSNNPNIFGLYTDKKGWMAVEKTLLEAIKKGDQKSVVRLAKLYSKYGADDSHCRELITRYWNTKYPNRPFKTDLWYQGNPGSGVGLTTKEDFLKWWSQGLSLGLIKTDGKVWQGPDSQRFLDWWAHGFTLGIVKSKKPHIEQGESIINYIARALTLSLLDVKGRKPTVLTNPCSTMRRPNKKWRVSMLSPPPVTKHILKEIELGPSSTEYDVKQQLIREGIAGEILGITLINPATWESYPGGKLGGAWDDIDFTEQDVKNRIIPKGTREYNRLRNMNEEEWQNYIEYHADQGVEVMYDKNTDSFIMSVTSYHLNPSELTHAEAKKKADWHRVRGRRARIMPVAGGSETNEYGVFLDGMRQHLPQKQKVSAKAQKEAKTLPILKSKPAKVKKAPKPKKEKPVTKAQVKEAIAEEKVDDIMAQYDIPKAPKIPTYPVIKPTSDEKVSELYKDWHDFYDKYFVYSSGIDRIVKELENKVSSLPPRDKQKSQLREEIKNLKETKDMVGSKNETAYIEMLIESRDVTAKLAQKRGLNLDEDHISEFLDDYFMQISHERPYVETNWNRTVSSIFDEVLAEHIAMSKGESQADIIEEMPPEHQQSEISADELAGQITKSLEALITK